MNAEEEKSENDEVGKKMSSKKESWDGQIIFLGWRKGQTTV